MFKSKIIAGITLLVFFIVTTSILTAGLIIKNKGGNSIISQNNSKETSGTITLSAEVVSGHSSAADCWIIISNYVYDVSLFLASHPGGAETITPYCGKDASKAFTSKDKNPAVSHSSTADVMLKDYLIGGLGGNINTTIPYPTGISVNGKISPNMLPTGISQQQTKVSLTLTSTEVAKHSKQIDCWMIISGNVYNFTAYISQHPGGNVMIPYCGKDGTIAFQNKGGQGTHSNYANSLLTSYFLGPLNSTVELGNDNSSLNTQVTPILPPTNNHESESEDD